MHPIVVATVFRGIQILGFPLSAVAYVPFVIKVIMYSRRSGVSATVLASFYTRWMQHQLGARRDEPCARLMRVLPNVSRLALRLVTGPTLVAHFLTGYIPRIYRYPYGGVPPMRDQPAARTTFFDGALERHLSHLDQLVILGAGLDTRAYRWAAGSGIQCFEVDMRKTQLFKREMLGRARVDSTGVTYVQADFESEDWFENLVSRGFEPGKPSFFLWEAVTMYLDRLAVDTTLRRVAACAPGSVVGFDYFASQLMEDRSLFMGFLRAVAKLVGEPFGTFGIDNTPPMEKGAAALLESCGLTLEENRTFGEETGRKGAPAGFATATVKGERTLVSQGSRPAEEDVRPR